MIIDKKGRGEVGRGGKEMKLKELKNNGKCEVEDEEEEDELAGISSG